MTYTKPYYPNPKWQLPEKMYSKHDWGQHRVGPFSLEEEYERAASGLIGQDNHLHIPTYARFAEDCDIVAEFGSGIGIASRGLLAGRPKKFLSAESNDRFEMNKFLQLLCNKENIELIFHKGNDLKFDIGNVDLLHIDSDHAELHIKQQIQKNQHKVKKYIMFHDSLYRGVVNGIKFLFQTYPDWEEYEHHTYNNGLFIVKRKHITGI